MTIDEERKEILRLAQFVDRNHFFVCVQGEDVGILIHEKKLQPACRQWESLIWFDRQSADSRVWRFNKGVCECILKK